jgi:hypothetical protein
MSRFLVRFFQQFSSLHNPKEHPMSDVKTKPLLLLEIISIFNRVMRKGIIDASFILLGRYRMLEQSWIQYNKGCATFCIYYYYHQLLLSPLDGNNFTVTCNILIN